MNNIKQYVGESFSISYSRNKKQYEIFTIPTQHFWVDSLDELTPERFEMEIEKQKTYEKESSLMINLFQKDYIFENKEVELSLPGAELSDIDNLTYFFDKYKSTVERGKPNHRAAINLKTYIDIIQVKKLIESGEIQNQKKDE